MLFVRQIAIPLLSLVLILNCCVNGRPTTDDEDETLEAIRGLFETENEIIKNTSEKDIDVATTTVATPELTSTRQQTNTETETAIAAEILTTTAAPVLTTTQQQPPRETEVTTDLENQLRKGDVSGCPASDDQFKCTEINDKCYCFIVEAKSRQKSSPLCKKKKMTLLMIETKEEEEALVGFLRKNPPPDDKRLYRTRGRDDDDANWSWDGEENLISYTNWCPDMPDYNNNKVQSLILKVTDQGSCWINVDIDNDADHKGNIVSVCESETSNKKTESTTEKTMPTASPTTITTTTVKSVSESSVNCPARIGPNSVCRSILNNCYCFVNKYVDSQQLAAAICERSNMSVLSIETKEEDDALTELLVTDSNLSDDEWGDFWTTGSREGKIDNAFYWDTEKVTYFNWCSGEPNNHKNEEHAIMKVHPRKRRSGCWNDIRSPVYGEYRSDNNIHIACELKKPSQIQVTPTVSVTPSKPCPSNVGSNTECRTIGTECYCFVQKRTNSQEEAAATCAKINMGVLSIETKEEDDALNTLLSTDSELKDHEWSDFWTTGSMKGQGDGNFYWDGKVSKKVSYFNWCSGEPNNYKNEEHALMKVHPWKRKSGCWNDIMSPLTGAAISEQLLHVACEFKTTSVEETREATTEVAPVASSTSDVTQSISCPSDIGSDSVCRKILNKCYCFMQERTNSQEDAIAACARSDMNLLSIETKEEDDALNKLLLADRELKDDDWSDFWTTGSMKDRSDNAFYWNGGINKKVSYFNWCSGEPNNHKNEEHALMKVHPRKRNTGCWNDIMSPLYGDYKDWNVIHIACESREGLSPSQPLEHTTEAQKEVTTTTESPKKEGPSSPRNVPTIAFEFKGTDLVGAFRALDESGVFNPRITPQRKNTITFSWSDFKVLVNGQVIA